MTTIPGVTIQPVARGVTDPEQVILEDQLDHASTWDTAGTDEDGSPWSARLYIWPGHPSPPSWLGFLREGFGDDVDPPDTTRSRAVVVVTVRWYGAHRLFVIAFGDGRHQLRRQVLDFNAVRKVQLNAIYEGDEGTDEIQTAPRIRDVEYVERGETTMRTRRQAGRNSDFDRFAFDPEVDQLVGVTGVPVDKEAFGGRISGKTSLRLSRTINFAALAGMCRNIARYEGKKDYQRRFDFVDRITEITNPSEIPALGQALVEALTHDDTGWEFAPPELIDFDRLATIRLEHPDLPEVEVDATASVAAIRGALQAVGLAELDVKQLCRVRVVGIGPDDELTGSWTLHECLEGQFTVLDKTFLLSAGRYSSVATDFVAEVNERLGAIGLSTVVLPDSQSVDGAEITEGEYNLLAANSRADYLLMDQRNVVISGKTSPIEVCDLLTMHRQLVHVKRKFSSATLSHLFSQGETSGLLLVDSSDFRAALREKMKNDPPAFGQLFSDASFRAGDFEIVYAMVGGWEGRGLADRLPFFSKVNLLSRARQLRRIGFRVTYAAIGVS